MDIESVSARGERAAISGYLPQFDAFASFAYSELINDNLEWIKVADPEAEKLDDIQYSTYTEIHAYQVKWTIADTKISYLNFKELFPLISISWKNIKNLATSSNKIVIPHLLTNKFLSSDDSIKIKDIRVGSFYDFYHEAFQNFKNNQPNQKWEAIFQDLKNCTSLNDSEFNEFISLLVFQPGYVSKDISVSKSPYSQQNDDLTKFSRFIIEKVADKKRPVTFTSIEIIRELGWENRVKTTFIHEFYVDNNKYQPIESTINLLDSKLKEHNNGYVFLLGGPGTGKSTLLTQWSKQKKDRIIKYYAFNFTNASIKEEERGDSTYMLFDLVFQIKKHNLLKESILPYKDIIYLREKFYKQIEALGNDFKNNGRKTILIIDGLDHVPREYKSIAKSFLKDLPLPISLPEGVFIILGSQTYELDDISVEIKAEYKKGERTIKIDALNKKAILAYLASTKITRRLTSQQQQRIVDKSQGHPLYLSYIIERLQSSDDLDNMINDLISIDGSIDNYYNKIWEPIYKSQKLKELLGLFSRINGSVNPFFVYEWNYDNAVLTEFREKARLLFNDTQTGWTFFHNSFKQFLLLNTSLNPLTDEYDSNIDINYHRMLSDFYEKTKIEFLWKRHYHLFKSKQFDKFIEEVTPEYLSSNLLDFRPTEEIIQDAKLGIEISKKSKDIYILTRYLFVLAEIERRLYNIDPAAFTKELIALDKSTIAKNYLRTENSLNCSDTYALKASAIFIEYNDKAEASLLFNMAYPDAILDSEIEINDSRRFDEIKNLLEAWAYVAHHFLELEKIIPKLNNVKISIKPNHRLPNENENDIRLTMLNSLTSSLINNYKWTDVKTILKEYNLNEKTERHSFFIHCEFAIEECLEIGNNDDSKLFLQLLLEHYKKDSSGSIAKIHVADLIYKTTKNINSAYDWIKDVNQPSNIGKDSLGYEESFNHFLPLIKLNKILNLSGKGVAITTAIPSVSSGTEGAVLVEFERMLCLSTQILCDGINGQIFTDIITRTTPIVRYYYKNISFRNKYWYSLQQMQGKYFDFLISATSRTGNENLKVLSSFLFKEISENPKFWPATLQREIIKSFLLNGIEKEDLKKSLERLDSFMLNDKDIDGRIEQCTSHARLWLHIGENDIAEKWLKQAIQESIGVGYRKDYQFSTWIEWLTIINKKDSENGAEKILWFLSHLRHIKNSTEGRAYWNASKELLESTCDWNLNAGFIQLKWQLENGLIDFEDSICVFVFNYIQRATDETQLKSIVQLYTEIVLFNIEGSTVYILNSILKKGFSIVGNTFVQSWIPNLIRDIEIKSLEENRFGLLSAIKAFVESLNKSIVDIYPEFELPVNNDRDNHTTSSNILRLKNGEGNLPEEDVLHKVDSFQSFKNILEQEDNAHSNFNWDKVIDKISHTISLAELKDLFIQDKNGRRGSDYYVRLSELALNLGDNALALKFSNRSLELSSESGWVQMYDGGTRIKAFKSMNAANPKISSDKAFEVFSHDLLNGNYASNYSQNLENIIPILEPNFDEKLIWHEIFRYLKRLMANSHLDDILPEFINLDKNITEILIDYLIYLSNNPIFVIRESAIKLLSEHINNGNAYAISYFTNIDITIYKNLEILNDIMMFLIEVNSEQLIRFKGIASQLAISKDYLIRYNACSVLLMLYEEIPSPEKIKLPEIYSLHLGELKTVKLKNDVDPYFPEVDLNDPEDLLRPFTYLIDFLSRKSGINRVNLIYRHNSIMKETGTSANWSAQYEQEFRKHLEEIRLKYAFARPRVIDSKRAVMRLVAELIDSNTINEEEVFYFLISHDYAVPYYPVIKKPKYIQTISRSEFGTVEDSWINKIDECPRFNDITLNSFDQSSVIAEYSMVKNLNWGTACETYMSQIAITEKINEDHFIFTEAFQVLNADYHELNIYEPCIIIIRTHRFDQFSINSNWIAINPTLARSLDWSPNPDKLFGWVDKENNLMVESIYWANGNTDMMPPKLHSESGGGWIVVASNKALEQIKKISPNLFNQKIITRSKWNNEKKNERTLKNVIQILN